MKKTASCFHGEYVLVAVALCVGIGVFSASLSAAPPTTLKRSAIQHIAYSTVQPTYSPPSSTQTSSNVQGKVASPSLVKVKGNPAVYYVDSAKIAHLFPDLKTYTSWYPKKTSITSISDVELSQLAQGILVRTRPGVYILKFKESEALYVAEKGGVLHELATAKIASLLFGAKWQQNVYVLPASMDAAYTFGDAVTTSNMKSFRTQLLKSKAPTIEYDLGLK